MPNRAVVITISDSRSRTTAVPNSRGRVTGESGTRGGTPAEDKSGPAIVEQLPLINAGLVHREVVPDEVAAIQQAMRTWIGRCDVILATGGTGVAERDVTPEAIEPLIEKSLPGFGEVMRLRAFDKTPLSIVSRGGAGIAGGTLIVWLPGSPNAVRECVGWLAPAIVHACALLRGEQAGH